MIKPFKLKDKSLIVRNFICLFLFEIIKHDTKYEYGYIGTPLHYVFQTCPLMKYNFIYNFKYNQPLFLYEPILY